MFLLSMDPKQQFLAVMSFRHACKLFDENKKVSKADEKFILEAGRLSPSSMGLEPWKFLVVEDHATNLKLQEACRNQPQIGTASFNVIIWAKVKDLAPNSEYISKMMERYGENKEKRTKYYTDFYQRKFKNEVEVKAWSSEQGHLAAANMMTAAAFIGIDSCPIGGMEPEKVKALFVKDPEFLNQEVVLIVCFGYRVKEQSEKKRLKFAEVVKFWKS